MHKRDSKTLPEIVHDSAVLPDGAMFDVLPSDVVNEKIKAKKPKE